MSDQVFEQHVDEHGNVSVRVSQDIVVLMREDADLLKARFDQLNAENARLRKLVRDALRPKYDESMRMSPAQWREYDADVLRRAHELGMEVDDG